MIFASPLATSGTNVKFSRIKIKPLNCKENLKRDDIIFKEIDKITPPWAPVDPDFFPECGDNDFFDTLVDFTEFNVALDSTNIYSSCGMDGIDFEVLQKLPIKFKLLLIDIFNEIYNTSEYPDSWRDCFVHFIEKPEKKVIGPLLLLLVFVKFMKKL